MAVEARGRLVEDQHARGEIDGARDRGDMLHGDGIAAKRRHYRDGPAVLKRSRGD